MAESLCLQHDAALLSLPASEQSTHHITPTVNKPVCDFQCHLQGYRNMCLFLPALYYLLKWFEAVKDKKQLY